MVFTTLNPSEDTYMLWHRFRMPTQRGSRDAVAVEVKVGNELIAAYAFMLQYIVFFFWSVTIFTCLAISARRYAEKHELYSEKSLSKDIWREKASPFNILMLSFKHLHNKHPSHLLMIPWAFIALSFIIATYTVPIIFAPYIRIGSAAPVRPEAIYFPSTNLIDTMTLNGTRQLVEQYELMVPSAQRAISSVNSVMSDKKNPVSVSQKNLGMKHLTDGTSVVDMQYGYEYNVTGLDLGLQNYHDLKLSVTGSCTTDYTWWRGGSTDNPVCPGTYADNYTFFNSPDPQYIQYVSRCDGGPPLATFSVYPPPKNSTNSTWGAIVSSVSRYSYSAGTDPWYLTNPTFEIPPNQVVKARPGLFCWENSVWSYRGHKSAVANLSAIPGIHLSNGIHEILFANLATPMIVSLGQFLGASALNSSSSAFSSDFDAGSSSIFYDLQRLVYGAYIATVNIMTETTLFGPDRNVFSVLDGPSSNGSSNGPLLAGAADFVIFSSNVVALEVRSLIIIPTIAMTLCLLLVLTLQPSLMKLVNALSQSPENDPKKQGDPEKQDIHNTQSSESPTTATLEGQEPNTSKPEHEISHGPVVSEDTTGAASQPENIVLRIISKAKEKPRKMMHYVDEHFTEIGESISTTIQGWFT